MVAACGTPPCQAPQAAETASPMAPAAPPADYVPRPAMLDDKLSAVRLKLQQGYYTSGNLDDKIAEKLTGLFDDLH